VKSRQAFRDSAAYGIIGLERLSRGCRQLTPLGAKATMDEETLKQPVKEFSARVWWGEQYLSQRRQVVASLEENGHDATTAREVLCRFEEAHAIDVAELQQLEGFLATLRKLSRS
jgi:hypothetical protein